MSGNFAHPERGEVVSAPLNIYQSAFPVFIAQAHNEGSDGCLGCVGHSSEFGLCGKQSADGQPIEATHELVVEPCLDAVSPTQIMEFPVGRSNPLVDPPVRPVRISTPGDDVIERRIDPELKASH